MNLNLQEYREKVLGCWMGKNIGGTLGAPFEWRRQINNVSFYTQDLGGEPLPNDDLDIQLLWLVALEEKGVEIDAKTLSEYWILYVTPHWSEYGNAKINLRAGLMPPLSGSQNNAYKDSCGSFIRSEIWACIAPGNPQLAARYAYEDAIIDHGNGEGVYAEVFCAALESAAFVIRDIDRLIEIGLSYIPADCGVAKAIRDAQASYRSGKTWQEARDSILEHYRGDTTFGYDWCTSEEDHKKGFGKGVRGWDVPSNIGMLIIGLLYGEGDFGSSICTAVNCGEDTDCTGATVGSIFGILHGIQAIPEKWITPIGRKIRTACLNLGELGYFGNQLPADVDDATRRTERIARQVSLRFNSPIDLSDQPTDLQGLNVNDLYAGTSMAVRYENINSPIYHFDFFDVAVDYDGEPFICDNAPKEITLRIYNTYKIQASLNFRVYTPEGWRVLPSREGVLFSHPAHLEMNPHARRQISFNLFTESVKGHLNRCVVELTSDGRPTVMLVPLVLQNGNYRSK